MPLEFTPGNVARVMGRVLETGTSKGYLALTEITLAVERQAKLNLGYAPHQRNTPTPAVPGKGPGLVSGTLRRSITHSPVTTLGLASWQSKVGTGAGFTPPYGKTPASHYGYLLETGGIRNGVAYPFLAPAVEFVRNIAGPVIYEKHFNRWPRMD